MNTQDFVDMLNDRLLYEADGTQKYSYTLDNKFVNRPPTDAEKARSDALGAKWKATMDMPMTQYVAGIKGNVSDDLKKVLHDQAVDTDSKPKKFAKTRKVLNKE